MKHYFKENLQALKTGMSKSKFELPECQQITQVLLLLWKGFPLLHRRLLAFLIPVVMLLAMIPLPYSTDIDVSPKESSQRVEITLNSPEVLGETGVQSEKTGSTNANTAWVAYKVQEGDTLSRFFRRNQLPMSDLNALLQIEGSDKPLSNIRPGQLIRYKLTSKGQLDILQLEKKEQSVMFFRLSDGGFGRSK